MSKRTSNAIELGRNAAKSAERSFASDPTSQAIGSAEQLSDALESDLSGDVGTIIAPPHGRVRAARQRAPSSPTFERWVDLVVDIVSRPGFVAGQTIVIIGYALLNSFVLGSPFDPYPYIFLNLILSMSSAYTSSIVLNSQRRQDHHSYQTSQAVLISLDSLRRELAASEQRLARREQELAKREQELREASFGLPGVVRLEPMVARSDGKRNGSSALPSISLVRDGDDASLSIQPELPPSSSRLTKAFCRE